MSERQYRNGASDTPGNDVYPDGGKEKTDKPAAQPVILEPAQKKGGTGSKKGTGEDGDSSLKLSFFLRRPVFSTVIAIVITLVGALSILVLPVEQFPDLTPPQVRVTASYPGASAENIADSVASLLESQINGVEGMIYMNSVSSSTGTMTLNVTFAVGTDPDQAVIDVNNRVQLALPQLPQEVQRMGLSVSKQSAAILQIIFLSSPDGRYTTIDLSNYALLNVVDDLKRVPGVGNVQNFAAQDYAMRVWLNPLRMAQLGVTTKDIAQAVSDQNAQFAVGRIGSEPLDSSVTVTWQIITEGRLAKPEQFENIILRTEQDGSILRLGDVARVELGAQNYDFVGKENNITAVPIGIFLSPGANALATAEAVKASMEKISSRFPAGMSWNIPYDTTLFVQISIEEVVKTLVEAMVLVFLVVYLFLQNWRATVIPCLAVPVSIVGTFAGMYLMGFSINTLTMFGLVLAIGMVVDDAIVVLENVERHIEDGLSPRAATAKAMAEVTGPVIAIVLVLCAVFIPVAFTGGMEGKMYQQFAVTIAVSVVISGIVALTFTPALCVVFLKPRHGKPGVFFNGFNRLFEGLTNGYMGIVKGVMRRTLLTLACVGVFLLGTGTLFRIVPTGLVPNEDQGYVIAQIILPDGASLSRSSAVSTAITEKLMKDPDVAHVMSFAGMDAISNASKTNYTTLFITMKEWRERPLPSQSSYALVNRIFALGADLKDGVILAFNPPPIAGMSNTGGFEMWIQNRAGESASVLASVAQKFAMEANTRPELRGISTTASVNAPQLYAGLDRDKARSLGVNVSDVFNTMQATFGSYYINDFNLFGRTFRVYAQSDAAFRSLPDTLKDVYVRNNRNQMIPVVSLINVKPTNGSQVVERFNNFPAAKVMGEPAAGYSTGQAMAAMTELAARTLPDNFTIAWSGTAFQQEQVGGGSLLIFTLALVMVFLILAAQYESFSLPLTVLTAVPFGICGALVAVWMRGVDNDIYFQVALVTLIGLSAKNAILIVEFAADKVRLEGKSFLEAAEESALLRFRPIVMTSIAFILGCVPLAISSGAGAASRQAIGTSVIGGMLFATIFAPLFVPFFFRWVMTLAQRLTRSDTEERS